MKQLAILSAAAVLSLGMTATALAAEAKSLGKQEYDNNCAVCHGATGKGDGPYAQFLRHGVPDLTVLSQKNKGVYPFERIHKVIDGRLPVRGHGTEEMPIWGDRYRAEAFKEYFFGESHPEELVRARILALVEYISKLQK